MVVCCLVENFLWTCFPGLFSECVHRLCLLALEPRIMGRVGGRNAGDEDCNLLAVRAERKRGIGSGGREGEECNCCLHVT